jgi:4-hydroxythreonine-4-phosphate dehydrogenase
LNPHGGEGGVLGLEEREKIIPVIEGLKRKGLLIEGPFSADTVFIQALNGRFDAIVAMYHDQGLIPLKLVAFEKAVNVTLNLPIIRTSCDHGCAFDIAGQNRADPSSMIEAIRLAARLAKSRMMSKKDRKGIKA